MNQLLRIDQFKQILSNYALSGEGKKILANTELVLFVGPSSSGRNTIINELVKTGNYHYIVSDTTRKPRVNNGILEQNGREYWFRTEEELLADLQKGLFLEAAIIHNQQVSGISLRELEQATKEGKISINEIEVVGADTIYNLKPDTTFIFVVPPSFDEWMARMSARGELPEEEMVRRLNSAVFEIRMALDREYYQFVVNDTFKHTTKKAEEIITGHTDVEEQERSKQVAKELLADTERYLKERN